MLASLTSVLARLDYPAAKLDIKLVLEAVDAETIAAARKLRLPGNAEIAVVPDLHPRTKPKALNYALPLARGEYLVIYDAEDRPERDQLPKPSPRSRKASQSCLPAGEARSLQCLGQLAYGSIHHRIRRTVRRALAGARPLAAPHPAWRDLKSFPRVGTEMADGLGPLQRDRGRRPRQSRAAITAARCSTRQPSRRRRRGCHPGSRSACAGSSAICRPGSCICCSR